MATVRPRIQVTIDDELAEALDAVNPGGQSASRLVRDLALRGAQARQEDQQRSQAAIDVLLEIATGVRDYDLAAAGALADARGERLR
ncbi:hypothetical protein DSM112329_03075 [Paraconexibacter sp. AEG42_29]|uniref:Ribbon-helix-helix protein CopG domain-containing protein n=1 Tax=Paraconexibacter sp. AEG42_29 TaxID=2997339 RepID=A0AAU7AX51_9ACTN